MKNQKLKKRSPFQHFSSVVHLLSFTVTWKWFSPTSQTYRGYYMHNFLSVSNLYMKNTFYIAIGNHFKKRSTCYIIIQGAPLYFIVSPFLYIQNNTNQNNAHHNKHSLSKQFIHFLYIYTSTYMYMYKKWKTKNIKNATFFIRCIPVIIYRYLKMILTHITNIQRLLLYS